MKEIICGIEYVVRELPLSAAEEVRGEVVRMLKAAELPNSNLSREEASALCALRQDKSIVVLKANKGNTTVLLDALDYHNKLLTILEDSAFKKLKKDSTGRIERAATHLLKDTDWPEEIKTALILRSSVELRIYGLLKIHGGLPIKANSEHYWTCSSPSGKISGDSVDTNVK